MRTISQLTLSAYLATTYRVIEGSGDRLDLRIGEENGALDALLRGRGVASAVFVTACNPFSRVLDDRENADAVRGLKADLERAGTVWLEGEGIGDAGDWPPEASVLALGPSRKSAQALCARYDQNAVVFCPIGAPPELILHPELAYEA